MAKEREEKNAMKEKKKEWVAYKPRIVCVYMYLHFVSPPFIH